MNFRGPEQADFANVKSLNFAFLLKLRSTTAGRPIRQQLAAPQQVMARGLTDLQIGRLAAVPFLLMSLRERDDAYWHGLANEDANFDLLAATPVNPDDVRLGVTGVAFLWQLSRRNPYAARLVSGATLEWCEQLADSVLLSLLDWTMARRNLLQPRLSTNVDFWNKLLGPGLSSEQDVRSAAHMAALQTTLTENPRSQYRPLRAAACSSVIPSLQVADKRKR